MAQTRRPITHHAGPMAVFDDRYEDGLTIDCLRQGWDDMPVYAAMFGLVGTEMEGEPPTGDISGSLTFNLPRGSPSSESKAVHPRPALRELRTSHPMNTIYTDAVPGVEDFAGAVMFDAGPVYVPPGSTTARLRVESTTSSASWGTCSYGARYVVEHIKTTVEEIIYDDDDWTAAHAGDPIFRREPGEGGAATSSDDLHWDNRG